MFQSSGLTHAVQVGSVVGLSGFQRGHDKGFVLSGKIEPLKDVPICPDSPPFGSTNVRNEAFRVERVGQLGDQVSQHLDRNFMQFRRASIVDCIDLKGSPFAQCVGAVDEF
ncbi:hypothetical protein [Rhodopirellula sp. P2]|uniref:hypothetical protein n=1 Tax=Rhodopirellula sp. P2 TaxID=2127060 RepID=UPI002367F194|nr:hypothetical protein [Rhodopirellula sp. P2]WDQ18087.1 hypothetical protein PSR62_05915 [Rhodopirellula sp. P2]